MVRNSGAKRIHGEPARSQGVRHGSTGRSVKCHVCNNQTLSSSGRCHLHEGQSTRAVSVSSSHRTPAIPPNADDAAAHRSQAYMDAYSRISQILESIPDDFEDEDVNYYDHEIMDVLKSAWPSLSASEGRRLFNEYVAPDMEYSVNDRGVLVHLVGVTRHGERKFERIPCRYGPNG